MQEVVIEVRGGVVQNVAVDGGGDIRVVVIDWDNIGGSQNDEPQVELIPLQQIRHLPSETQHLIGQFGTP